MSDSISFEPNWAVPPGATIDSMLAARSLSREAFAASLGEPLETVQRLLLGLQEVDADLAERLSRCLGSTQRFWLKREEQYRDDLERAQEAQLDQATGAWIKQIPVREMRDLGWIAATAKNAVAHECLKFFGVPDVSAWQARYGAITASASFRMSLASKGSPGAVAAWLRWAELVAGRTQCSCWNPGAFRDRIIDFRRLTWQKNPGAFLPTLRRLCAEVGVAVVVARTPRGCPASGATRFVTPNKALIVLSFRYRSDDQFWFTFFHEAGHLLLHDRDAIFLEDDSEATPDEEAEANAFAASIIVPSDYKDALLALQTDKESILRFARRVGVAPGLIVGQLQHRKVIRPDQCNFLKRRYDWNDIDADRIIP